MKLKRKKGMNWEQNWNVFCDRIWVFWS